MGIDEHNGLVDSVLRAVTARAGVQTSLVDAEATGGDACIALLADGRNYRLPFQVKVTIDRRDQLLRFRQQHGDAVLVTSWMSRALADMCSELGIQFVDRAGNCLLNQPGLYIFVSGLRPVANALPELTGNLTPSVLRVIFAILVQPALLQCNVRQVGEAASISRGAAAIALGTIEQLGLSTRTASRGRRLVKPERWLDIWTEGYLGRIRPRLEKYRMSADMSIDEVIERVSPRLSDVVLGGEAAAARLDLGLKPGMLTLYLDLDDRRVMHELAKELKLRRAPDGDIELVDIFWNAHVLPSFPIVPEPLVYADLIGTGDERAMEIAADLKQRILSHVAGEAY